jgi:cell division septum initiation protein DivIVA
VNRQAEKGHVADWSAQTDRADPAVRAEARRRRLAAGDRTWRVGTCLTLAALAVSLCATAAAVTGEAGATVGAVVIAVLLVLLAWALWPSQASAEEHRHRELESIWHTIRTDADNVVAWDRYGAWAEAAGDTVELHLIRCAPVRTRIADAPSPFSREVVRRVDADDIARAAAAMEEVRAQGEQREQRARERTEQARVDAERKDHDRRLREIDSATTAELERRDAQLRAELAQQAAAERRSQAEAVARALRRP